MSGERVTVRLTGSPPVASIAAVADWIGDFAGGVIAVARCVCDTSGERSEPVDLSDPAAAEVALAAAGWVRDIDALTDTCPTCADGTTP